MNAVKKTGRRSAEKDTPNRILLIDCPHFTSKKLAARLIGAGFSVACANSCQEAALLMKLLKVDMVILGYVSGESLTSCRQLRSVFQVPVIMIGQDSSQDIWEKALLDAKAEFYVKSPFSMEVLVPRIKAVLRRYLSPEPPEVIHATQVAP